MDLDEYVKRCICEYPSLYVTPTYEESRMKILGYFFNSINYGLPPMKEFRYGLKHLKQKTDLSRLEKYFSEKFYDGYYNAQEIKLSGDKIFLVPANDSKQVHNVLESERVNYPDIKLWYANRYHPFTPYPYFKTRHSIVHDSPMFRFFPDDWIQGGIDYYEHCKKWFNSDAVKNYSYYYVERNEKSLTSQLNAFGTRTNEQITKDWECEYTGDVHDFKVRIWQKEKQRILLFIDETLDILYKELKSRKGE